jgi:4-hydroxybenzoate polyprenyltransferase
MTTTATSDPHPAALIQLLRPQHWIKNLLVFAGVVFSRRLLIAADLLTAVALFAAFSAVASAVYIFNDWVDAPADRLNPAKASRPLAAGTVSVPVALSLAMLLAGSAVWGVWTLDRVTGLLLVSYVVINILYTLRLKREPILDVGCIASGFMIRAFAGATVIHVPISRWLLLCSIFLSLFLGLSKTRQEIVHLKEDGPLHRPVLKEYSETFLDHVNAILAAAILVCYTLYTVDGETVARFGTDHLVFTVPFVVYGIFRYLYLVHQRGWGAAPVEALVRDRALGLAIVAWGAVVALVIYYRL